MRSVFATRSEGFDVALRQRKSPPAAIVRMEIAYFRDYSQCFDGFE
jgi:hypothetical protein